MKTGVQNTLVYRFNFFFRAAFSLVPLLATIYLWRTVFRGQTVRPTGEIGNYTLAGMISHYLLGHDRGHVDQRERRRLADRRRHQGRQHQPVPAQADRLHGLPRLPVLLRETDFSRRCPDSRWHLYFLHAANILSRRRIWRRLDCSSSRCY